MHHIPNLDLLEHPIEVNRIVQARRHDLCRSILLSDPSMTSIGVPCIMFVLPRPPVSIDLRMK